MTTRSFQPTDRNWVLALNKAFEVELSPLDAPGLQSLVDAAFLAQVADPEAAFLIALDQRSANESPNFLWFCERYEAFVYVDRIAVSASHRRRGHAVALYDALFAAARVAGHSHITCEVNSDPPNPGSDAFHFSQGFEIVGERYLDDRDKTVRYMSCALDRL